MLRMSATETKFLARVGGASCPAYGFFRYFALSFYMSQQVLLNDQILLYLIGIRV